MCEPGLVNVTVGVTEACALATLVLPVWLAESAGRTSDAGVPGEAPGVTSPAMRQRQRPDCRTSANAVSMVSLDASDGPKRCGTEGQCMAANEASLLYWHNVNLQSHVRPMRQSNGRPLICSAGGKG